MTATVEHGSRDVVAATEKLLEAALSLPSDDRFELVEALLGSLDSTEAPPSDEAMKVIVRRRSEELRTGKVTPIPWSEVKRLARGEPGE